MYNIQVDCVCNNEFLKDLQDVVNNIGNNNNNDVNHSNIMALQAANNNFNNNTNKFNNQIPNIKVENEPTIIKLTPAPHYPINQRHGAHKSQENTAVYNMNKEFLMRKFGLPKEPLVSSLENKPGVTMPSIVEIKKEMEGFYDEENYKNKSKPLLNSDKYNLVKPKLEGGENQQHVIVKYNVEVTSQLFLNVPHKWLDGGKLLQLIDPQNAGNIKLFQQQWSNSQPIIVSNCHHQLNSQMWSPEAFLSEFGGQTNSLIDCSNNMVLDGFPMAKFWGGFEQSKMRIKDANGGTMILKLKDWPPTADFSEMLPPRFKNLLEALPLPEYSHRDGVFNIVSQLPDFFTRPDLGPKMYNAYGSALTPTVGSTNLHLDISDAVNLMVYVGVVRDDEQNDHEKGALLQS